MYNFTTQAVLPLKSFASSLLPNFLQPYRILIENVFSYVFLPFFFYFTAIPFIVRFICVPLVNKTLTWNKHKIRWDKQQFKTHLTCSICIMKKDKETNIKRFQLRTLFERNIVDILYRNMNATHNVLQAAKATTVDNSWLIFPEGSSSWMIFNSLLNNISEHFSLGHLAYDLDCPVKTEWYIFGITYAKNSEIPFRKLRIFLMKESTLLEMNENDKEPEFESSKHNLTYQAIQSMSYMVKRFLPKI
eukprot:gene12557-6377_t